MVSKSSRSLSHSPNPDPSLYVWIFNQQARKLRKSLIPTVLCLLNNLLNLKTHVNLLTVRESKNNLGKRFFYWHLESY